MIFETEYILKILETVHYGCLNSTVHLVGF